MRVRSLGWEDHLEEGRATHSNILARKIPQTEEPGGLQSKGLQRAGHDGSDLAHKIFVVQSLSHVRLFCDPMDCSMPGFPVLQQEIMMEWREIPLSKIWGT